VTVSLAQIDSITGSRLWAYSAFAAVLSGAGLPIFIYAPKFFADTYGVSLAVLGAVLFGLRLFDVVQDPVLGWLSSKLRGARSVTVLFGGAILAGSMLALFAIAPPIAPVLWFALAITGLFSAFSFLSITFYAQGIAKAEAIGSHTRLAGWRETGALLGVCLAAVAPTALTGAVASPFSVFAFGFAICVLLAVMAMASEWHAAPIAQDAGLRPILRDLQARRLLLLALVNATPVAVSSTLFLFFVESRLAAPGWEGGLLVLFFLAAAVSAPGWSFAARIYGPRRVLLAAMFLAIVAFGGAATLGAGDVGWFAVICVLSGATIGADLTLLPALFARRLAVISPDGGQGFGLWTFANKLTLAMAAGLLLPLLERAGFSTGAAPPESALVLLSLLYALVPCLLKVVAITLLLAIPLSES